MIPAKKIKMKVTVIGDSQSGKTSFIRNLVSGEFIPKYTPTQNFQITIFTLNNNNTEYQIHLWDCGATFFQANKFLRKAFFRNSSATFLIFDLCDPKWRQTIPNWIQQAYNCEAFLLYLIGTKKDLFQQKTLKDRLNLLKMSITQKSLFDESSMQQVTQDYEYQNNLFFQEYQVRHFYQSAKQKVPYQIKNIFVSINDDKQKLSRSSLARGSKFDNSLVEGYMHRAREREKQKRGNEESLVHGSVKFSIMNDDV